MYHTAFAIYIFVIILQLHCKMLRDLHQPKQLLLHEGHVTQTCVITSYGNKVLSRFLVIIYNLLFYFSHFIKKMVYEVMYLYLLIITIILYIKH
jgi:hypothetical protein